MPFYDSDNLTCWFYSLFEEEYERAEEDKNSDEYKQELENIVNVPDIGLLREWCYEQMELVNLNNPFGRAIINSVDLEELKQMLIVMLTAREDA
jgi:hypothetical protein